MRQHIPNFLTGLRIVLTPLIAFVIWQPQSAFLAALALFCSSSPVRLTGLTGIWPGR